MKIFIVAPISPLDRRKVFFDLPWEKIAGESTPWVIPQSLNMRWKVSISNSNTMKAVAAIVNIFSTKKNGEVESSESGVPTAPAQSEEGLKQGELADPVIKRKKNNLA